MASSPENVSMALFCDFENVALGVRDVQSDKFDIKRVLERLLLKGSIVVKKAYCDWDRYKGFKATMHEANFELIEIPHVRQSGKNSADIRLVVDALDLCYTKSHVNTFVIISGDSDFSPLVSKLRENAKYVIGVGVKQSTSDLLIANCDEFIFYDDLVREGQRAAAKRETQSGAPATPRRSPEEESRRKETMDARRTKAIELAVETFEALVSERGDSGKMWASVLKEAIKRRRPDFSESYFGFRTFGNLLEEAQARGLLEFGRDEKSGAYVYRSSNSVTGGGGRQEHAAPDRDRDRDRPMMADVPSVGSEQMASQDHGTPQHEPRRRGRGGRNRPSGAKLEFGREERATNDGGSRGHGEEAAQRAAMTEVQFAAPEVVVQQAAQAESRAETPVASQSADDQPEARRKTRGGRKAAAKKVGASVAAVEEAAGAKAASPALDPQPAPLSEARAEPSAETAKPATRSRRPRKPAAKTDSDKG